MPIKRITGLFYMIFSFFASAFVTQSYIDKAIAKVDSFDDTIKEKAKSTYEKLQKLVKTAKNKVNDNKISSKNKVGTDNESLSDFFKENFDIGYIASNSCKSKLDNKQVSKIEDSITKFAINLLSGEAIKRVTESSIDINKMAVNKRTNNKKTDDKKAKFTSVKCILSDDTEFTALYLISNNKLIDIICYGVSIMRTLNSIIEDYCSKNSINFMKQSVEGKLVTIEKRVERRLVTIEKREEGRLDTVIKAINWHIKGRPK